MGNPPYTVLAMGLSLMKWWNSLQPGFDTWDLDALANKQMADTIRESQPVQLPNVRLWVGDAGDALKFALLPELLTSTSFWELAVGNSPCVIGRCKFDNGCRKFRSTAPVRHFREM